MTRLLALLLFAAATASAQPGQTIPSWIWVEADGAGAVLMDGVRAGSPGEWLSLPAGTRTVTVVDDAEAWDPRRADWPVEIGASDSVRVQLTLPRRLRVETLPIRAEVARVRPDGTEEVLGTAPLSLDLGPDEAVALVARLGGYDAARLEVEPGSLGPITLVLRPHPETDTEVALLPTERSTHGRTLVDVGIGAAALAAGAVAVHLKFRADAVDDRYRTAGSPEFGDATLREEALRLDRLSAVALGAMQAGVGVLAVRFVLR